MEIRKKKKQNLSPQNGEQNYAHKKSCSYDPAQPSVT